MSRIWRYPDLRNGTTLHHISDTHFGAINHKAFVNNWADRTAADIQFLRVANRAGHVMTGDMIEMGAPYQTVNDRATETSWYRQWREAIRGKDQLPWAECVGNHDMRKATGESVGDRTATGWALEMGIGSQNMVHDMGQVRVITIGPDVWDIDQPGNPTDSTGVVNVFRLPASTLTWLNTQLQTAGKPCFIGCHIMLQEQNPGTDNAYNAANEGNPGLTDVLASNPNAVGWLSGHAHTNIQTKPSHATVITVGGRKMFAINSPGSFGGTLAGVADANHQWLSVNQSMYLTYFGDALDVRWRNHNTGAWTGPGTETVRHLSLSTVVTPPPTTSSVIPQAIPFKIGV